MTTELAPAQTAIVETGYQLDPAILAGEIRESTIVMYRKAIKEYLRFAGSTEAALAASTLARWRAELAKGDKSPNTVNRMLSSVRAVIKAAEAQGYVRAGLGEAFEAVRGVKVAAMREKLKSDARTRITAEQMRCLVEQPNVSTLAGRMHRALLLTMASSGLRISEVVTLTPGQIKEKRQGKKAGYVVYVTGKSDTEAREAPISVEAYKAIQEWLNVRPVASGWIFTGFTGRGDRDPRSNHIHTVSAWELVKRYAAMCGFAGVKPHDFRRFVGTTLAKTDPRQAQKALGHKDINTTYKHYVLDELEVGLTDGLF